MKNFEWDLEKGEKVVGDYRASKGSFFPTLIVLILGLLLYLIAHFSSRLECAALIVTMLAVIWVGIANASLYFTTKIEITNRRILGTQSIAVMKNFSEDTDMDLQLEDVVSIGIAQDSLAKKFNYGNIVIRSDTCEFQFRNIESPNEINETVLKLKEVRGKQNA